MSREDQVFTAFVNVLRNDSTFSTLATGGIYDPYTDGVDEIAPPTTYPGGPYDANGQLQTCVLVKPEVVIANNNVGIPGTAALPIAVYAYQKGGCDELAPLLWRAYQLLHDTRLTGVSNWEVREATSVLCIEEPVLNCMMGMRRFIVQMRRA